ncbi:hypothetical protein L1887_62378 [Cichorium endivia]|nr:hypothetical protein L1887_62378 [Cichorium endivia]
MRYRPPPDPSHLFAATIGLSKVSGEGPKRAAFLACVAPRALCVHESIPTAPRWALMSTPPPPYPEFDPRPPNWHATAQDCSETLQMGPNDALRLKLLDGAADSWSVLSCRESAIWKPSRTIFNPTWHARISRAEGAEQSKLERGGAESNVALVTAIRGRFDVGFRPPKVAYRYVCTETRPAGMARCHASSGGFQPCALALASCMQLGFRLRPSSGSSTDPGLRHCIDSPAPSHSIAHPQQKHPSTHTHFPTAPLFPAHHPSSPVRTPFQSCAISSSTFAHATILLRPLHPVCKFRKPADTPARLLASRRYRFETRSNPLVGSPVISAHSSAIHLTLDPASICLAHTRNAGLIAWANAIRSNLCFHDDPNTIPRPSAQAVGKPTLVPFAPTNSKAEDRDKKGPHRRTRKERLHLSAVPESRAAMAASLAPLASAEAVRTSVSTPSLAAGENPSRRSTPQPTSRTTSTSSFAITDMPYAFRRPGGLAGPPAGDLGLAQPMQSQQIQPHSDIFGVPNQYQPFDPSVLQPSAVQAGMPVQQQQQHQLQHALAPAHPAAAAFSPSTTRSLPSQVSTQAVSLRYQLPDAPSQPSVSGGGPAHLPTANRNRNRNRNDSHSTSHNSTSHNSNPNNSNQQQHPQQRPTQDFAPHKPAGFSPSTVPQQHAQSVSATQQGAQAGRRDPLSPHRPRP